MPENRRVEPRSIIGNGNATDPESIVDLEDEWARRLRGQRPAPRKKFVKVVDEVAKDQEEKAAKEKPEEKKTSAKDDLPKTVVHKEGLRPIRA